MNRGVGPSFLFHRVSMHAAMNARVSCSVPVRETVKRETDVVIKISGNNKTDQFWPSKLHQTGLGMNMRILSRGFPSADKARNDGKQKKKRRIAGRARLMNRLPDANKHRTKEQ